MNSTWIIILSLFGFIALILGTKILFSFFKKDEKPKSLKEQEIKEFSYEGNFMTLEAILNINKDLQESENSNISKLNEYIKNELLELISTPEYIFNLHKLELNDYLNDLIQNKLLKNSASMWNKKFDNEITMLQFKNKELQKLNGDLKDIRIRQEIEILKGWENAKRNY